MRRLKLLHPRVHISGIISGSFCSSIIAIVLLSAASLAQQQAPPVPDANHPGWVVISVDEYQDLRAHAFPTDRPPERPPMDATLTDRKSTRLNSSHVEISYAVFCLKKKKNKTK